MNIGQWVHFSVDDVIGCFQWVYENEPQSIFEEPMLAAIKRWHEKYGLQCDLYVFERNQNFNIAMLQDRYWEEICQNSWLRLGWHGLDSLTNVDYSKNISERAEYSHCEVEAKEYVQSLKRFHNLVFEKCGAKTWTNVVRLHMWTTPLCVMESLKEENINVLLTSDRDLESYNLSSEQMEKLKKCGGLWIQEFCYTRTDIRFDNLSESITVKELLEYTETIYCKYPAKKLEIFFHEWMFDKIEKRIEQYFEHFEEVAIPIVINAGTVVENQLYFTSCNSEGLYKMDLNTEEVSCIARLPYVLWNERKFISLCYYHNKIWMIPLNELFIYTYDLIGNQVEQYPISCLVDESEYIQKFRKVIEDGKYLWLLPSWTKQVIRVDMETESAIIFSEWPKELAFEKDMGVNFTTMSMTPEDIVLFGNAASKNIFLSKKTGKMVFAEKEENGKYSIITSDNSIIISPLREGQPLQVIEPETMEHKKFFLPNWIWNCEEMYAFWYAKQIDRKVFVFSHESNGIVIYDMDKKKIECIPLYHDKYSSIFLMDGMNIGIFDVFKVENEYVFLTYNGNTVIWLDEESNCRYVDLFDTVRDQKRNNRENLEAFIFNIHSCENKQWSCIEKNGQKIFDMEDLHVGKLVFDNIVKEKQKTSESKI